MNTSYKPLIVAVFLVVIGLTSKNWIGIGSNAGATGIKKLIDIAQAQEQVTVDSMALVGGGGIVVDNGGGSTQLDGSEDVYTSGAFQDPGQPIGTDLSSQETIQYKVKRGDTLSGVAVHFNVSADSIVNANPNIRKKSLRVGQVITIPGIAVVATTPSTLPSFNSSFILPAQGYNSGTLEDDNVVEIENACGTPVVASADGVVVPDKNIVNTTGGWNDGFGTFVLLEHPFGDGIFTRYAHLQQSLVSVGDYVKQGEEIGLVGQTGDAGACELGFSVVGAQNPFGK